MPWALGASSSQPWCYPFCHALSLLAGDLQYCGGTAIPGLTDSLVGLKEPFLYSPLVFLQHLLSVAGVHVDQVEGVTQKGILHLAVQLRIRAEAGGVVHLPRQAGHLTWHPSSQPMAPAMPHTAHGCFSLCQRQGATHSTLSCSVAHLCPPPQDAAVTNSGCSQDKGSQGLGNSLLLDGVQEMGSLGSCSQQVVWLHSLVNSVGRVALLNQTSPVHPKPPALSSPLLPHLQQPWLQPSIQQNVKAQDFKACAASRVVGEAALVIVFQHRVS